MYPAWRLNRPYGVMMHNGLNLSKSVYNPHSRLWRMLQYLVQFGPRTRKEILRDVFGIDRKGWGSTLFLAAQRAKFIDKIGTGHTVRYTLGSHFLYIPIVRTVVARHFDLTSKDK